MATATALALIFAPWMSHRLNVEPTQLPFEGGQWVRLAGLVAVLSVPFFTGGLATLTSLLLAPGRTGRLYGASFAGGALGVALALLILFLLPPARSLVLPPVLAALGALALGWRSPSGAVAAAAGLLGAGLFLGPSWDVQLTPYKSLPQLSALPGARRVAERFSPLGWVLAVDAPSFHVAPGLSLAFRGSFPRQTALLLDGDLAGAATDLTDPGAEELARALPASLPHALAVRRRVLLVGVGDGLALEAALVSDAEQVVTLEPNPDLLRLARELGRFKFWQEQLLDDRVGQARAVLARGERAFDSRLARSRRRPRGLGGWSSGPGGGLPPHDRRVCALPEPPRSRGHLLGHHLALDAPAGERSDGPHRGGGLAAPRPFSIAPADRPAELGNGHRAGAAGGVQRR